jgi:hypothetical protein
VVANDQRKGERPQRIDVVSSFHDEKSFRVEPSKAACWTGLPRIGAEMGRNAASL